MELVDKAEAEMVELVALDNKMVKLIPVAVEAEELIMVVTQLIFQQMVALE